MIKNNRFRFFRQLESLDCAPACLKMIAAFYGRTYSLDYLRTVCKSNRLGTSVNALTRGAEKLSLDSVAIELDLHQFGPDLPLPCVLLFNQSHFVVLVRVTEAGNYGLFRRKRPRTYHIADPGFGMITINSQELANKWQTDEGKGIAIFFEPGDRFADNVRSKEKNGQRPYSPMREVRRLLHTYRSGLMLIFLGMMISSVIAIAFPLLTQRIVDVGIAYHSISFITLVFCFQIGLFIGMLIIDAVKAWILLHIGAKIELSLTYNFLSKIMRLPLYFFDVKIAADLMQRIGDNSRIQLFIKNQLLDFLISIATFFTLTVLMLHYNAGIYACYIGVTSLSLIWAWFFIRKKEILDYRRFDANTENTDNIIETIVAMPEIRINSAEKIKLRRWERGQLKLFDITQKLQALQQYQNSGTTALNTAKNLVITFLSAQQVILGHMTLGEMLGVSAIIGQLNVPISQMITFSQAIQEARISFSRLSEIQSKAEEDAGLSQMHENECFVSGFDNIRVEDLSFSYTDSEDDLVFNRLNIKIPVGKMTAIVGLSGSGKTTLMKLLLKFYEPLKGRIVIGNTDLDTIPAARWRKFCGVVMQEGHIFSDTVENNIAMSDDIIDRPRLMEAARIACADIFIDALPLKYRTRIGSNGIGLSTGQKQRILIARAVYKDPAILIFDEATSALDATNEKLIQENLKSFFRNRTVIVIAHRLSTVKDADNIIVMDRGKITEQDNHDGLIRQKGAYYELVKNQLELGN